MSEYFSRPKLGTDWNMYFLKASFIKRRSLHSWWQQRRQNVLKKTPTRKVNRTCAKTLSDQVTWPSLARNGGERNEKDGIKKKKPQTGRRWTRMASFMWGLDKLRREFQRPASLVKPGWKWCKRNEKDRIKKTNNKNNNKRTTTTTKNPDRPQN